VKINSADTRRVHVTTSWHDGERVRKVTWGDVRSVSIGLEPGEVPDMLSGGYDQKPTMFRPEYAAMEWQRTTYWGLSGGSHGWKYPMSEDRQLSAEKWLLTNASIRGTNIKVNGELGKLTEAALYANDEGWGIRRVIAPPDWYAALLAEHDPNVTGGPLDDESEGEE